MAERRELGQFLLLVFPLLIPCFALWYLLAAPLAVPAIGLANLTLTGWFPEVVSALYVQGPEGILATTFGELDGRPVPPGQSDYQLGFTVDTRLLSYSFPFYTALHFATRKKDYLGSYLMGALVLYALMTASLVCLCMKDLMYTLGPAFVEQPGVLVPHPNLIAVLYQLSILLLPTLAPVLLWAWQSRDTALVREILDGSALAQQSGPN